MALNVFSTKKNDVMKNFKKISALVTCMILQLSFVTWSSDCPPPSASCWDVNNSDNWGNWDDDSKECVPNVPRIDSCWIGCDCSPE
jgi:hypothetical protein